MQKPLDKNEATPATKARQEALDLMREIDPSTWRGYQVVWSDEPKGASDGAYDYRVFSCRGKDAHGRPGWYIKFRNVHRVPQEQSVKLSDTALMSLLDTILPQLRPIERRQVAKAIVDLEEKIAKRKAKAGQSKGKVKS